MSRPCRCFTGGAKDRHHSRFGGARVARIVRIEHCDHGDCADGVAPRPLAVDERILHILPVLGFGHDAAVGQGEVGMAGVAVEFAEELDELFQIDPHLKGELAERHLRRAAEPVKVPAIGLGVDDRLDCGNSQQPGRFLFGQLRPQGVGADPAAVAFRSPYLHIAVELFEDLMQLFRVESRRLP